MNDKEARMKAAKDAAQAIQYHAAQIYSLLEPGMVMTITIPTNKVVVPNQPQSIERIIIIRPTLSVSLKVEPT